MPVNVNLSMYRNPSTGRLDPNYDPDGVPLMTVEGTFGHGNTITVRARNFSFGEQQSPTPALSENFSSGSNGQLVYDYDNAWIKYAGDGAVISDRSPRYSGSLSAYNGSDRGQFFTNNKLFSGGRKIFVSYWARTDNADIGVGAVSGGDYGIIKWARIGSTDGGGGIYNGKGMHSVSNQQPQAPSSPYSLYRDSGGGEVNLGYLVFPWNSWFRIEMQIYLSDAGVANGHYNLYSSNGSSKLSGAIMQRDVGDTHTLNSFLMGLEIANYSNRVSYYVSNLQDSTNYSVTYLGTPYSINSGVGATQISIANALAAQVNADGAAAVTAHVSPSGMINLREKSDTFSPPENDFTFSANFSKHYFGLQNTDIFVQVGSYARLVAGNASTWSACSEASKEVQSYTSWNSGAVNITQNTAAIAGNKWLYFVKDDNTVQFENGVALQ